MPSVVAETAGTGIRLASYASAFVVLIWPHLNTSALELPAPSTASQHRLCVIQHHLLYHCPMVAYSNSIYHAKHLDSLLISSPNSFSAPVGLRRILSLVCPHIECSFVLVIQNRMSLLQTAHRALHRTYSPSRWLFRYLRSYLIGYFLN